jgi:hypothetical protein
MNKWLKDNDSELNEMYEDYIEGIHWSKLENGEYDSFEEFAGMVYMQTNEGQIDVKEAGTEAGNAKVAELIKDEELGCKIARAIYRKMLQRGIKKETLELYFA